MLQGSGLKYDNIIPQIWAPERFNKFYCQNDPNCIQALNNNTTQGVAFVSGKFVITREGPFYQVITSALREMMLGIALNNSNAKSERAAEIAGNLGFSFAYHVLAEKFGYDPQGDVADTPENRNRIRVNFASYGRDWGRVPWLVDERYLDRNRPAVSITSSQALDGFKLFVIKQDPDGYADSLIAAHDVNKDSEWATQALQARLRPGKTPKPLDTVILSDSLFYLP